MAAPRGHAKTTVSSTEILYRIVNGLNHHILVVSDTYTQAKDIVDNIRSELEANAMLRWVYGELQTDWHWTSGSFTTSNECRVVARGSNMKVRGLKYKHWRPDLAVGDDLENDEAVIKPERREKLLNWIKRALLPAMAKKGSQVAIVGTILHEDSLLNNLVEGREGFGGWGRQRHAAIMMDKDGNEYSIWPSMFPIVDLKRMRDDPDYERYLGPIAFAQEMMNEAIDDAARIIKREWIYGPSESPRPYSFTEKMAAYRLANPTLHESKSWLTQEIVKIIMAVDPAISEKTTADYFAMAVIGVDREGQIWQLDTFRERIGDIDVQVNHILDFNDKWKPDQIKVEAVAYQAGLSRAVQKAAAARHSHAPVFPVTPDKDKFRRAVLHSANFAGGLIHLRTDHPLFDLFVKELLDFPVGKNDDMFDAFMHASEDLVQRYKTRTFAKKARAFGG